MDLTNAQIIALLLDALMSACVAVLYRTGERKYLWKTVSDLAILRFTAVSVMSCLLYVLSIHPISQMRTAYFVSFYLFYLGSVALTLKLFYEVYRKATVPLVGFSRWGLSIFAWIVVVMIVMTLMTMGNSNAGTDFLARAGINMMRAVETVNVCLAAFICYLIRSMGLSLRSKVFGIMGGFMVGSTGTIIQAVQYQLHIQSNPILSAIVVGSCYLTLAVWIGYAFLPEPLPRPVTVPADSPVYRWSQIAASLGTKTQVAMPEPQHSFFLADVEKVVDKVFTRHMQETPETNG